MFDLNEYLKGLKRKSKADDIPGTVQEYLDELCPACGDKMKLMKPCCGSPNGLKECGKCHYKITI